jgi:hypothetical protein
MVVRSVVSLAGALVALVAALPASALAAGDCSQPAAPVFSPWGDDAQYALAPNGGLESGASGWRLTDGAAVQAGNEQFQVGGADDASSLAIPAGADATSAPACIDVAHPTIRLFARNQGSPGSVLHVSVVFPGLLGGTMSLPVGSVTAGSDWQPTASLPVLVNLLSLLRGDQQVSFRFSAGNDGGDWSIDDLYVDPYSKG